MLQRAASTSTGYTRKAIGTYEHIMLLMRLKGTRNSPRLVPPLDVNILLIYLSLFISSSINQAISQNVASRFLFPSRRYPFFHGNPIDLSLFVIYIYRFFTAANVARELITRRLIACDDDLRPSGSKKFILGNGPFCSSNTLHYTIACAVLL